MELKYKTIGTFKSGNGWSGFGYVEATDLIEAKRIMKTRDEATRIGDPRYESVKSTLTRKSISDLKNYQLCQEKKIPK